MEFVIASADAGSSANSRRFAHLEIIAASLRSVGYLERSLRFSRALDSYLNKEKRNIYIAGGAHAVALTNGPSISFCEFKRHDERAELSDSVVESRISIETGESLVITRRLRRVNVIGTRVDTRLHAQRSFERDGRATLSRIIIDGSDRPPGEVVRQIIRDLAVYTFSVALNVRGFPP